MVVDVQAAAQRLVPVDDGLEHAVEMRAGDPVRQSDRLGLRQPPWLTLLVEPVHVGQHGYRPALLVTLPIKSDRLAVDGRGEFADGRTFEHQPRPQRNSAPAGALHHRERDDAVEAELTGIPR